MGQAQTNLVKVPYEQTELFYEASNEAVIWRANTLYKKEPDTVSWISQFQAGEVLVDIGANVGMYTVLAAKGRGVRVFAFEPESQNYALLNRNIVYNQIQHLATAFPLALGDKVKVDRLYLSEFGLGGSCHTFGDNVDYHLRQRNAEISQGCVSFPLDQLVADGVIPIPDHIKIDVDGLEHIVLDGAARVLADPNLKSVLVELNTHLVEHQALISRLLNLGFEFDQRQVDIAVRQAGAFQGVGNYIFYRPDANISFERIVVPEVHAPNHQTTQSPKDVQASVIQRLAQLQLLTDPYPHFCLADVFPEDFYQQLMSNKPVDDELICLNQTGRAQGYAERFVMPFEDGIERLVSPEKAQFWRELKHWLLSEEFMVAMIKVFQETLVARGVNKLNVASEAMFMRDQQGYQIGPHTDSPKRLLSVMFYLPGDSDHSNLGTSVYRPLDKSLECDGTRHHEFKGFERISTAPYCPNTAFGFLKTSNSFHGVERLQSEYARDSLVYIIKHKE